MSGALGCGLLSGAGCARGGGAVGVRVLSGRAASRPDGARLLGGYRAPAGAGYRVPAGPGYWRVPAGPAAGTCEFRLGTY
ncbi:hypothetical protein GCM10018781_00630 [Kitasatospora indigofera]|uniref:Uncharacterized protein n=1 Tax=Kitasatospora indigofera TaxID=67307 RepID=A0A919KJ03_9ACTN|nr:hypothetical protein GCM10018781_00630 [Kitasatospora indigofera]